MSNALPITQGLAGAASGVQAQPQAQAQVSVFGTSMVYLVFGMVSLGLGAAPVAPPHAQAKVS